MASFYRDLPVSPFFAYVSTNPFLPVCLSPPAPRSFPHLSSVALVFRSQAFFPPRSKPPFLYRRPSPFFLPGGPDPTFLGQIFYFGAFTLFPKIWNFLCLRVDFSVSSGVWVFSPRFSRQSMSLCYEIRSTTSPLLSLILFFFPTPAGLST